MKKRESKLTQDNFDFIINNLGKITQRKIAKKFNVHYNYISMINFFRLRYNVTTIEEFRDQVNRYQNDKYQSKIKEKKIQSWQTQIEEGVELYFFVTRRLRLPRKMVYQRLRKDFEDIQRMKKAA